MPGPPTPTDIRFKPASLASTGLLRQSVMALATAILLILSFPIYELGFLAWVALAPLLFVIANGVTLRRALWLGWLTGFVFTFISENWIAHSMVFFGGILTVIAYAVAMLFAAILAVFPAIFAAVMSRLSGRFGWPAIALAPFVWVATEWLRPLITGVTWNALGVSQAQLFQVARLSQYGGVYLISAEIVAAGAIIVLFPRIKEKNVGRVAVLLFIAAGGVLVLAGLQTGTQPMTGPALTVVGVQPNLRPDSEALASDLENCLKLTREGIDRTPGRKADLVIWAESPLALFYENDIALRQKLDDFAGETGGYFILNTVVREDDKYFNSVHTIDPKSERSAALNDLKRYDKIRLVPFGEYIPLRPLLGRFVPTIVGDFTPGRDAVVNTLKLETTRNALIQSSDLDSPPTIERTTNYVRTGSFICYETAYPDLVRRFVKNGATLLVNVSNDAWFGKTAGMRQHLMHATMRAIENDRDLLRVTNTGISALIKADGRIVDPLPIFEAGAQVWQAQARSTKTFYTRHGDWFAIASVLVSIVALAIASIKPSR